MTSRVLVAAGAAMVIAAQAFGSDVVFRIVERTNQTVVTVADSVTEFSIQARVSGAGLATWGITSVQLVNDPESRANFFRMRISNPDGTYYAGAPQINNIVGQGGVAASYSFLASVNAALNGSFNTNSGSFINGPDNEIGEVGGACVGPGFLGTPGVDTDGDGRPDVVPAAATTGVLPSAIMQEYFAQNTFIDIYRFRVAFTDLTPRSVNLRLNDLSARTFSQIGQSGNQVLWGGLQDGEGAAITSIGWTLQIVPTPGASCAIGLGGLGAAGYRRRR